MVSSISSYSSDYYSALFSSLSSTAATSSLDSMYSLISDYDNTSASPASTTDITSLLSSYGVNAASSDQSQNDFTTIKTDATALSSSISNLANMANTADPQSAVDAAKSFAQNYNQLLADSQASGSTDSLAQSLISAVNSFSMTMADSGIDVGSDGKLSINETQLQNASENGSLSYLVNANGSGSSFSRQLQQISETASTNPAYYTIGTPNYSSYNSLSALLDGGSSLLSSSGNYFDTLI